MVPQLLEKAPVIVVFQAGFWLFKILESVTAESGIKQKIDDLCERQEEKARAENLHQLLFDPGIFMDAELDLGFGEDDDEH